MVGGGGSDQEDGARSPGTPSQHAIPGVLCEPVLLTWSCGVSAGGRQPGGSGGEAGGGADTEVPPSIASQGADASLSSASIGAASASAGAVTKTAHSCPGRRSGGGLETEGAGAATAG